MARSDAFITVTCDNCGGAVEIQLTAIARGGYDERDVDAELEERGWLIDHALDICPGCQEDDDDQQT